MHKTLQSTVFLCLLLLTQITRADIEIDHEYKVNQNGKISLVKHTDAPVDLLITVMGKKEQIHYNKKGLPKQAYILVKKGIMSQIIPLEGKYKGRKIEGQKINFGNDQDEAIKVFEFLSDQTYVEWSFLNYGNESTSRSALYTTYRRDLEYFGAKRTYTLIHAGNITSLTHYHNHPRYSSEEFGKYAFPSYPDLLFRDEVQKSNIQNTQLKIRTDQLYIDYTDRSKWPTDALL